MKVNPKVRFDVLGVSRDSLVTKEEFLYLLRRAKDQVPFISLRKQGRGLGARKRRIREARRKRAEERLQDLTPRLRIDRRSIEAWIRVFGP